MFQDKIPRYINPYTDFGFKKLFGTEANKDLLVDFLNQLLPSEHQIVELEFKNPEILPELPFLRKAIFDIFCKGVNGESFIVEMQKEKMEYFKDRSLFYVTFPIQEDAKKGFEWNFKLKPIYFIAILDFKYDESEERKKFERHVQLKDQDGEVFYKKLHFKFLQMPLFNKTETELESRYDKWCYFLKHLDNFDSIPAILKEPIFERAFQTLEVSAMNKNDYETYQNSLMSYWESKGVLETAHNEGKIEGKAEGKIETLQEIILNAKKAGFDDEMICKLTGLTKKQLDEFKEKLQIP